MPATASHVGTGPSYVFFPAFPSQAVGLAVALGLVSPRLSAAAAAKSFILRSNVTDLRSVDSNYDLYRKLDAFLATRLGAAAGK